MKNKKNWFKYIVIFGVLLIPFMYSFFYLKAYWDPYGKMEDIPVAIVNKDEGVNGENKGKDLINTLKEKNTLNLNIVDEDDAYNGLNNKEYYAVISIPNEFTSDLLSAKEENKNKTTITYSPNQKTNYLASQIISRVVSEVEKNLRSNISKEVVSSLTSTINGSVDSVNEISTGLSEISNGTKQISMGSKEIDDGTSNLSKKYSEFNNGVKTAETGSKSVYENMILLDNGLGNLQVGVNEFSEGMVKLQALQTGISSLKQGEDYFDTGLNTYVLLVNSFLDKAKVQPTLLSKPILSLREDFCNISDTENCTYLNYIIFQNNITDVNYTMIDLIKSNGNTLISGSASIKTGINELNTGAGNLGTLVSGVNTIKEGVNSLKSGSSKLVNGSKSLNNGMIIIKNGSNEVATGIASLNEGTHTLSNGASTLNNGVNIANKEIINSLSNSKNDLKKLEGLDSFVENPIKVEEKDVNKVSEYGTAFSPLFISIALWVGSLMLFIILYFDVNDRFKLCSRNAENKIKRTFCYLGLAALQGIFLGVLLIIGLNLDVTNYLLYFSSLIIVSFAFESIMEFLILCFGDIGKFISLIILVLQLAAAGGTFPIETVANCFQKLFNFLPMKYTIDLFKESLISIENGLLCKSLIVISLLFVVFFIINIARDIIEKNKKA